MTSKFVSAAPRRSPRVRPRSVIFRTAIGAVVLSQLTLSTAHAGTPLICHPYEIGDAPSLPAGRDWHGVDRAYDRRNLERDTFALLKPQAPVIVRMETLRRAAIYATAEMRGWHSGGQYTAEDRAMSFGLLEKLRERAKSATGADRALALFDAGFFAETLRHTGIDRTLDGYAMIVEAAKLRGGSDPEIEFALALATSWPNRRDEHSGHLARARASAERGSLLATNLASHFGGS